MIFLSLDLLILRFRHLIFGHDLKIVKIWYSDTISDPYLDMDII
jgi:hypothetical protein